MMILQSHLTKPPTRTKASAPEEPIAVCRRFEEREKSCHSGSRAQALLEFALALPILLLVVYGLLEAGRLIFMYAAVATSSRDAVRYASAAGMIQVNPKVLSYQDCDGIRNAAKRSGFLLNLQDPQIKIYWDNPGPYNAVPLTEYCKPGTPQAHQDTTVLLGPGNRVLVNVTSRYTLLVPIVPFTSRDISSGNTARTFMGEINLATPTP